MLCAARRSCSTVYCRSAQPALAEVHEQVWVLDGPDRDLAGLGLDHWLMRSDYIAAYEFAVKGNDDFAARRIFSEQDDAFIKEGCDLAELDN